jgi:hypothetical protein
MLVSIVIAFAFFVPQTPCASPGPDLTIGDINSVANFTSSNGIEACGFGLKPTNVGSVWIDYFASTPRHPVFGQSLYRLSTVDGSTRLEEIGQSWLRHGFFALSNGTFCTCTPTNGQHLGIGCNDTSSASLNADPTGLGPRWQVNAATGVFPFPVADPPHPGVHDRRLQVAVADLAATGGPGAPRYFVEAQCVAPDDAPAGLGANNASHRELLVTGAGSEWTFALTSSTQRERPAVYAWQDADPEVVVSEVQVPGDGRFLVASRATDLGGGTWHYEYAVLNQNSARSGQAFRVPLPLGSAVSNPGFHDVAYHSGDGPGDVDFDGTDWSAVASPTAIVFSTSTQDVNPSANALRWSTTYNFRFDAAMPPGTGSVQINLFEPGSPSSVQATAIVPFLVPPPPQSLCFGSGPGSGTCPCGNAGLPSRGCENSVHTGGATLSASGNPSLSADAVVLTSTGELPSALSVVLQGNHEITPVNFGDGLRCAGGALKRLYVKNAVAGSVTAPQAGDPSVSAASAAHGDAIEAGATRVYQIYYRDPNPTWCPSPPGSTFNASSAVAISWGS